MPKKYELTNETKVFLGKTLYRIRALIAFGNVAPGDLGGWIEKEENLGQEGTAWVTGNAWVTGTARVTDNALVTGNACVTGNAEISYATHCLVIGAIGSRNDHTTFMRSKEKKIIVSCGCFRGTIDEFEAAVRKTHGESKHAKAYLAAIELAKIQIEDVEEGGDSK